jgi:hypothetical protein
VWTSGNSSIESKLVSALGKGEAKSSILFGSTSLSLAHQRLSALAALAYSATVGGTLLEHTSGTVENPWTDVLSLFRGQPCLQNFTSSSASTAKHFGKRRRQ